MFAFVCAAPCWCAFFHARSDIFAFTSDFLHLDEAPINLAPDAPINLMLLSVTLGAASAAFLPGGTPVHVPRPMRVAVRATATPRMQEDTRDGNPSAYDQYMNERGQADIDAAQEEYLKFKTLRLDLDSEFDGGDSGSSAVGDGNVDLEDQHNAVTLGANRGGVSDPD